MMKRLIHAYLNNINSLVEQLRERVKSQSLSPHVPQALSFEELKRKFGPLYLVVSPEASMYARPDYWKIIDVFSREPAPETCKPGYVIIKLDAVSFKQLEQLTPT